MKKTLLAVVLILTVLISNAQTTRNIIVEHFTNTNCGICANKNPVIYNLLSSYPDVLHIAYHPSSPYASCALSMQNPIENDARTNYYGIYGGTPRVVVQGKVIPNATPTLNATSLDSLVGVYVPFELKINARYISSDSVEITSVIKTTATNSFANLNYLIALTEDTVFYTGFNGEAQHYDVFHSAINGNNGLLINPASVNDSLVLVTKIKLTSTWNSNLISFIGMLQESTDKRILQAVKQSEIQQQDIPSGITSFVNNNLTIYPNPASDNVTIKSDEEIHFVQCYNSIGQLAFSFIGNKKSFSVKDLNSGNYFLLIQSKSGTIKRRIIIL